MIIINKLINLNIKANQKIKMQIYNKNNDFLTPLSIKIILKHFNKINYKKDLIKCP